MKKENIKSDAYEFFENPSTLTLLERRSGGNLSEIETSEKARGKHTYSTHVFASGAKNFLATD
jgi:hypothetical protein